MVSRKKQLWSMAAVSAVAAVLFLGAILGAAPVEGAEQAPQTSQAGLLGVGAGLAVGLAAVGAGFGVGTAGAAALGAIAEKKEMLTWGLVFVALAEGIALYGLVIAFMLVGKI